MATYPTTIAISPGSKVSDLDDIKIDRATNGMARGRALYTSTKRRFELRHAYLTPAQRDTLRAFYTANRLVSFVLDWHEDKGVTISTTCVFSGPIKWECISGVFWTANVVCEEV